MRIRRPQPASSSKSNSVEAVQDGQIFIELINWPFRHDLKGTPPEYGAGLNLSIERGWLWLHTARINDGTGDSWAPAMTEQGKLLNDIDTLIAMIQFDVAELKRPLPIDERRVIQDHLAMLISDHQMLLRNVG
jgi:hypothetical protein